MRMRLPVTISSALLSACTLLQPPTAVPVQSYVLESPAVAQALPPVNATGPVLVVAELKARPGYDSPRMAYIKRDYQLDYYATSQWADTPARMLQPLLVHALEATGRYSAVLGAPAPVGAPLRLDGEIVRLEQSFVTHPSRVRMTLRVQMLDVYKGQVLGTRTLTAEAPAPSEDAYGGVRAANQALAQLLREVAAFCVAVTGR